MSSVESYVARIDRYALSKAFGKSRALSNCSMGGLEKAGYM